MVSYDLSIYRFVNQRRDYTLNNRSFIHYLCTNKAFTKKFEYIRNNKPRYTEVLTRLLRRNGYKHHSGGATALLKVPDELSYMYYLFYSIALPMILKSDVMYILRRDSLAEASPERVKSGKWESMVLSVPRELPDKESLAKLREDVTRINYGIPFLSGGCVVSSSTLKDAISSIIYHNDRRFPSFALVVEYPTWRFNESYQNLFQELTKTILIDASPRSKGRFTWEFKAMYGTVILARLYVTKILRELDELAEGPHPENAKRLEECLYYNWLELVHSISVGYNVAYKGNVRSENTGLRVFDNPIIPSPTWSHDVRRMLNEDLAVLNSLCSLGEDLYSRLRLVLASANQPPSPHTNYPEVNKLNTCFTWLARRVYDEFTGGEPLHKSIFPGITSYRSPTSYILHQDLRCRYGHTSRLNADETAGDADFVNGIPFLWTDDAFNPLAEDRWYQEGVEKKHIICSDKPDWLGNWSLLSEYIDGIQKWDDKWCTEWSSHLRYIR